MCGLVGVVTNDDVGVCLYDTLTVLQHRGPGCGRDNDE